MGINAATSNCGHERESPNINVVCAVSPEEAYGLSFLMEDTNGDVISRNTSDLAFPQLQADSYDSTCQ